MFNWAWKWGLRLLAGTGGLGAVLLSLVVVFQRKLLYVPDVPGLEKGYYWQPDYFKLDYEDVWLDSADGTKLHAWLVWPGSGALRRERKEAPVILFFQENAGNMSYRLPYVRQMAYSCDCVVLMLSYRGYGSSKGSPSQTGFKMDAEAALNYVLKREDLSEKIVLFGRSLGGAVAIQLGAANKDTISAIIIENSFTSVGDMAGALMPPLKHLVGKGKLGNFLVKDPWNSQQSIAALSGVPTLMLSSGNDEMVPAWQMQALYEARGADGCQFEYFPDGNHLSLYETHKAQYWPVMVEFLAKVAPAL